MLFAIEHLLHIRETFEAIGGAFVSSPSEIVARLDKIEAFVFDWDGVFNMGQKGVKDVGVFTEADSIGCNLLRYGAFYKKGGVPFMGVISGQRNEAALVLAKREGFNVVYLDIPDKTRAVEHLCLTYKIDPSHIAYFFDDVSDFPMAALSGLRILINRKASPLMRRFVESRNLCDYITGSEAQNFAIRESCELLLGLWGIYDQTVQMRMEFDVSFKDYLSSRNRITPHYFLPGAEGIVRVDDGVFSKT